MPKRCVILAIPLVLSLTWCVPARAIAERAPNIILILADDLGYGDLGFNGRTEWQTPHLDRLAKEGTVFRRWYTAGVVCVPSRAALLTGKYGIHNGATGNGHVLAPEQVTIAEALKPRGYATGHFGKWHLSRYQPQMGPGHPLDQGFDEFFGFIGGRHAWEKFPSELVDGREVVPSTGYGDALFTDRSIDFIQRHRDDPFFLYLAYTASHGVVEAPPEDIAQHKGRFEEKDPSVPLNATYAAMVTRMDKEIGRVLATLEELELERDTIVVFTSDHGATFERIERGTTFYHDSNRPFRGQKRTLWEGGIRVPGVVRWPGRVPAGRETHELVHMIDLFPTFLAAAGATPDAAWQIDGHNVLPSWTGQGAPPQRTLFWEWRSEGVEQLAAMRGDLKLITTGGNKPELFDVERDPAERRTLHAEHPDVFRQLNEELQAWLATETEESTAIRARQAQSAATRAAQRRPERESSP